jgi:hypothetical protein
LLATHVLGSAEESLANILTQSGSDVTTGPLDDVLFAIGSAINRGANEVEDFVENKFAQGFDSIKNTLDRLSVSILLMVSDNSTINTDFTDEMEEVTLVKGKGAGQALEIADDTSDSIASDIKTEVQGFIDNYILSHHFR